MKIGFVILIVENWPEGKVRRFCGQLLPGPQLRNPTSLPQLSRAKTHDRL